MNFVEWFEQQVGPYPYGEVAEKRVAELREELKSHEYHAARLRRQLAQHERLCHQASAAGWAWNAKTREVPAENGTEDEE